MTLIVRIAGLAVDGHFGVTQAERAEPQRILVDLSIELAECTATETDDVGDTADYGVACRSIIEVAAARPYKTLERFCDATYRQLAELYLAQGLSLARLSVKATKLDPPLERKLDGVSVELLWRAH